MSQTLQRIAFVSPAGGTGQTTLAANLARVWSASGRACLALDLCPQDSLGLHLGLATGDAIGTGWAPAAVAGHWWAQDCRENAAGVRFLPFGALARPDAQAALQRLLQDTPDWLERQLDATTLDNDSLVLMDAPAWPQPLARQALACADLVVVCLDATPRSVLLQPRVQELLAQAKPGARHAIVASRFSPRAPSRRQALEALQQQWPGLLSPYVQHEDENASAALVAGQCVVDWMPQAQSAHDVHGLAQWLAGLLAGDGTP